MCSRPAMRERARLDAASACRRTPLLPRSLTGWWMQPASGRRPSNFSNDEMRSQRIHSGREATMEKLQTRCCIVGGGPAGMMLGLLLARKGVEVVVLEKHKDFFRDFRGDTVH